MKVRIKQYQGKVRLRLSERGYIWGKRLSVLWTKFLEKGHEKMTVMLIPHNEKRIFNFQISKFTISFFVLLFIVILVTSAYAVIRHTAVKREEQRLLLTYEDLHSNLSKFEQITKNISDIMEDIKPEAEALYELTAGSDELDHLWEYDEVEQAELKEMKKNKHSLPNEIFKLKELQRDIQTTTNTIKSVKNFVDVRNKVVMDLPSTIPNLGHITSLFGWRRSPWGHSREFHCGIDIAASAGVEIHATAPGTVSSAGWTGGLGNTVRIQHKYGFETLYGHCRNVVVSQGQVVKKGDVIGFVGQTGNATGNHCHYEVRLGNVPINPYPYMSRIW